MDALYIYFLPLIVDVISSAHISVSQAELTSWYAKSAYLIFHIKSDEEIISPRK
jgi:hypothetical protein